MQRFLGGLFCIVLISAIRGSIFFEIVRTSMCIWHGALLLLALNVLVVPSSSDKKGPHANLFSAEHCLPTAVLPTARRDLRSDLGTFPLGLWVNGNPHDVVVSAAFAILVEEVLGINVYTDPRRKRNVLQAFYALAGCTENVTASESQWLCSGRESRVHVMIGAYVSTNEANLASIQRMRMGGIINRLGSAGYALQEGLYIGQSLVAKGWDRANVALEYYRSYHVHGNPASSFNTIWEVNASYLVPCAEWGIYSMAIHFLDPYVTLTGHGPG